MTTHAGDAQHYLDLAEDWPDGARDVIAAAQVCALLAVAEAIEKLAKGYERFSRVNEPLRMENPYPDKCSTCGHSEGLHCPEDGHGPEGSCGCFHGEFRNGNGDWTQCPCERFSR